MDKLPYAGVKSTPSGLHQRDLRAKKQPCLPYHSPRSSHCTHPRFSLPMRNAHATKNSLDPGKQIEIRKTSLYKIAFAPTTIPFRITIPTRHPSRRLLLPPNRFYRTPINSLQVGYRHPIVYHWHPAIRKFRNSATYHPRRVHTPPAD